MAVCGILGNAGTAGAQIEHLRSPFKKYCHEPQIGNQDARADVVSLSQSFKAQLNAAGGAIGQMLNNIGQALQSGDITAAQNAFNPIDKVGPCAIPKGSHVPPMAGKLTQGLTALGAALQSGDLSSAQQAYTAVQQVWQQMSEANSAGSDRTLGNSSGVSVRI